MSKKLLSIRMHASFEGQHLSGAERLVEETVSVEEELQALLKRALHHPRGRADRISLQVDEISSQDAVSGNLLDFSGFQVDGWKQGRMLACRLLTEAGVSLKAATLAMEALTNGAAENGASMRGAMLVDARSGERLEADRSRGVRASRMDLTDDVRSKLRRELAVHKLDNPHVVEAITLASKVVSAPQVVAELCWSDDPDYVAGYVASAKAGYTRISSLKPIGEERGGRAFFVRHDQADLESLIQFLERTPYLIDSVGEIGSATKQP